MWYQKAITAFLLLTSSLCQGCQANGNDPGLEQQTLRTAEALLEKQNPAYLFVTPEGALTPQVVELLALDGIYDPQDSLDKVVEKTQERWIAVRQGKNQIERTDLVDSPERVLIREKVVAVATQMGLFKEVSPLLSHYSYGVCLGAFLDGVRLRLAELVTQWKRGIRFDSLVFLTGERYLRKGQGEKDDFEALCNPALSPLPFKPGWTPPPADQLVYETEYDMVKLVWDQVQIPEEMLKALKEHVVFVNASKGDAERASTADTYKTWLTAFHPQPGTVLAPSHPLLWCHQQLVGAYLLGPQYPLNTIAPAASEKMLRFYQKAIVSLIFDTVAKCLYEIHKEKGKI
jgi:hypothetical protein